MKPETQNWLQLAAEDYDVGLYLFKGARYTNAVYHLCLAVEKALEAAQIEIDNQFPKKTYDLVSLGLRSGLPLSDQQISVLAYLSKHYNKLRSCDYSQTHYNTRAKIRPIITQATEMYLWISTTLNHQSLESKSNAKPC
jgi:HEPN domain-containing protein